MAIVITNSAEADHESIRSYVKKVRDRVQTFPMVMLDGSVGEGGGQVLRTALSLSIISGQEFTIRNIRARRAKPGLQRQHLAAVKAAAAICSANITGAEINSQRLRFRPGRVAPGDYAFDIGSAGSTTLLLQTILPPLMVADAPSSIRIEGGTHNPMAPPFEFLERAFLRVLSHIGPQVRISLESYGFYPAGGGRMQAAISPAATLQPITIAERGRMVRCLATAIVARLPAEIAERELKVLRNELELREATIKTIDARSPVNVLLVEVEHEHITEVFMELGERGVRAETVASRLSAKVQKYLKGGSAPISEHLADQLLVPFAMAGAGSYETSVISDHTTTNIEVIQRFLPVQIGVTELEGGTRKIEFRQQEMLTPGE